MWAINIRAQKIQPLTKLRPHRLYLEPKRLKDNLMANLCSHKTTSLSGIIPKQTVIIIERIQSSRSRHRWSQMEDHPVVKQQLPLTKREAQVSLRQRVISLWLRCRHFSNMIKKVSKWTKTWWLAILIRLIRCFWVNFKGKIMKFRQTV